MVGRRQELVQRLLYVLTYFIRCSELLETHMLDSAEDEAIVIPGSLITTSLRKGEVEESEYVLVTVHKPSGDYLSQGTHDQQTEAEDSSCPSDNSLQSSTYTDAEMERGPRDAPKEEDEEEEDEDSSESQGSRSSVLQTGHFQGTIPVIRTVEAAEPGELRRQANSPVEARLETVLRVGSASPREQVCVLDAETKSDLKVSVPATPTALASSVLPVSVPAEDGRIPEVGMDAGVGNQSPKVSDPWPLGNLLEKKPPDKNVAAAVPVPVTPGSAVSGPMTLTEQGEPATKVTFLIGDSMSPESDTESRRNRMEEDFKKYKKHLKQQQQQLQSGADSKTSNTSASEDQTKQTKAAPALQRVSSKRHHWSPKCMDDFDEYFSLENPVEIRTIDDEASTIDTMHKDLLDPSGVRQPGDLGGHCFQGTVRGRGLSRCSGPGRGEVGSSRKEETFLASQMRCRCGSTDSSDACSCRGCSAEQDSLVLSVPVPQHGSCNSKEDQKCKAVPVNDWEIPRNESSDSALGDSESEETEDWQEEVLVPFPG